MVLLGSLVLAGVAGAQQERSAVSAWDGWRAALAMGAGRFEDSDFWDEIARPLSLGIQSGYVWPNRFGLDLGVAYLWDDQGSDDPMGGGSTTPDQFIDVFELSLGPLYSHPFSARWEGYAGVGLSWVAVQADTLQSGISIEDTDSSAGFYIRTGVNYHAQNGIYLGLDLRSLLATDLEFDSSSTDVDYLQIGLHIGGVF